MSEVDRLALHDKLHSGLTVTLLIVGILCGTAGNYVSLPWGH